MKACSSVHPHAFELPGLPAPSALTVPVPEKEYVFRTSSTPLPFSKIWVLNVPVISPAVVICMMSTRLFSSGSPFDVPLSTYQAPPVKSSMRMFCPSVADPAANALTHGWSLLSTMLIATWSSVGTASIPMVTQLSAARSGKKENRRVLISPAVVPPKVLL